jgi:hypothetical protein
MTRSECLISNPWQGVAWAKSMSDYVSIPSHLRQPRALTTRDGAASWSASHQATASSACDCCVLPPVPSSPPAARPLSTKQTTLPLPSVFLFRPPHPSRSTIELRFAHRFLAFHHYVPSILVFLPCRSSPDEYPP